MTTYGTIPTSSPPGPPSHIESLSRAKERIKAGLGTRQPWKLMFNFRSIGLPRGFSEALTRIRTNVAYFRMNYAIVVLIIIFLSLLWHPISLIVFIVMICAWLFLYFLRDDALVIFGRTITDRVVLIVLTVITIVLLFLTGATWNIVGSLLIGAAAVVLHAALRRTEDLFLDEEAVSPGAFTAGSSSR